MKEKTTRAKVQRMFDGMLYHCMDITEFMNEHVNDPYFDTEEGAKLMDCMLHMCLYHSKGCIIFMKDRINKNDSKADLEEILKKAIEED